MKKIISALIGVVLFAAISFGQSQTPVLYSPSYQTVNGYNAIYSIAMTDSTGTTYSPGYSLQGYLPQDIYTNYIPCYIVATGTADSVDVLVQTRMKTGSSTYSTWTTVDSVAAQYNKVDGIAHFYAVNFNGGHPDQMRFVVAGKSTVNRSDVVVKVIAVLTKQFGIFKVQ